MSRLVTVSLLLLCVSCSCRSSARRMGKREIQHLRETVKEMFHHGWNNYMQYAFPHDELKPLSRSFTDSLGELGNSNKENEMYTGVAMTMIDSLDSLAILGNLTAFRFSVKWISDNISFDQDVRVNVFEANIRLLGGLLSAHMLAIDPDLGLMGEDPYDGGLLRLATDLGNRLLRAFDTKTGIPFAWVNLRHGVISGETSDTCTAGVGTLILEFGVLSYLTSDFRYYDAAFDALEVLYNMRDPKTGLVGNTLDVQSGRWTNRNAGIGAGIDSFYEYLFKAYVLFGNHRFLQMFESSYASVMEHLRLGPWYLEASMTSGHPSHVQFNSLQAFWPGLQVLSGHDVQEAIDSQKAFYSLWKRFGALPERFLLGSMSLHSTERYYPLRPELMESTYLLYLATRDHEYLDMGEQMIMSLQNHSRVEHGFAALRDVQHRTHEDVMHSFFLAETCMYLYLMFDEDNFIHRSAKYLFTTEGHVFPLSHSMQSMFRQHRVPTLDPGAEPDSFTNTCPLMPTRSHSFHLGPTATLPHMVSKPDANPYTCPVPDTTARNSVSATASENSFFIEGADGSDAVIRHLGTSVIEVLHRFANTLHAFLVQNQVGVITYVVEVSAPASCARQLTAMAATFGPDHADFEELSAELQVLSPSSGCVLDDKVDVSGHIVMVDRGDCSFEDKALGLFNRGAAALIIANILEENNVFLMGADNPDTKFSRPVLMISGRDAVELANCARKAKQPLRLRLSASLLGENQSPVSAGSPRVFGSLKSFEVASDAWRVRCYRRDDFYQLSLLP